MACSGLLVIFHRCSFFLGKLENTWSWKSRVRIPLTCIGLVMTSEQPDCGAEYLLHNILLHSLLENATNE